MSSFASEEFYPSHAAQTSAATGANTVASLQAGHPFSLLLADDDTARETMLEVTLDAIADAGTRFVRATNPLRARLTLERLLIQVIEGDIDLETEAPARLIRRIASPRGEETRVLLVIERAETLHPEVLRFFGETAVLFPDATPRLQILFVGRPEFQQMIDHPDAGLDDQAQRLDAYRPAPPEPIFFAQPDAEVETATAQPHEPRRAGLFDMFHSAWDKGWPTRIAIVGGTLGGLAAVTFAVFIALTGNEPQGMVDNGTPMLELPEAPEADLEPPVLQPGPPRDEATAALRTEFETYLIASGRDLQGATAAQKRAVYQDFLVWRARTGGGR